MSTSYELTGEIDALRLKLAERIDGATEPSEALEDLKAVLILLTAAADRAEESGL